MSMLSRRIRIDQFRYIKIQPKTIDLSTRLMGITTEFVGFIPESVVLKSIVLGTRDAQLLRLFETSDNDKGNNVVTRKVAGNHVGFIFMFQNSQKWQVFALMFSVKPQAFMRHRAKLATFC